MCNFHWFPVQFRVDILLIDVHVSYNNLLPTSQPSEDARLARRQRIVPREELLMQKNF